MPQHRPAIHFIIAHTLHSWQHSWKAEKQLYLSLLAFGLPCQLDMLNEIFKSSETLPTVTADVVFKFIVGHCKVCLRDLFTQ